MGPPWFFLPYPLFLPNTNETCPHPSKEGRSAWAGYAFDVTAHIPQERGGASGWMFGTSPHPLGEGSGQGVGVLRWLWWLMNPRSTVIDVDLAFKLCSNLKDFVRFLQNPDIKPRNQNDVAICQLHPRSGNFSI
jgi:hypothetical protein